MNKLDMIRNCPLFAPLATADQAALAMEAKPLFVDRAQVLCRQDEPGRTFYIVGAGQFSVGLGTPPKEIAKLGPGAFFGEMSLLTGATRTATVSAVVRSEVLELDRPVFSRLFTRNPQIAQMISRAAAQRRMALKDAHDAEKQAALLAEEQSIFGKIKGIFGI